MILHSYLDELYFIMKPFPLVLVLPAYNEELTIEKTILEFYKEIPNAFFVIVDNNSKDSTSVISKNILTEHSILGEVIFEPRQGKANAIRTAFTKVDAEIYIMCDADLTYPASKIHSMIQTLKEKDLDMLVGDRLSKGDYGRENKRRFHSTGNKLVLMLINFLFGTKLKDPMSGYRVFSRRFVKNYPILTSGFEIEIEMTLHALDKRFRLEEISVPYKDRPAGSFSKLNTIRDGYKVVKNILWIFKDYKPMHFFGFFSVVSGLLSLVAGTPPVLDYIRYKYVYHVPLAVLATGLMLFSWIQIAIGLVLHTVSKIQRANFELRLLRFGTESPFRNFSKTTPTLSLGGGERPVGESLQL
ncbi:glycosyltransferase family 2 protein [Leptospira johnsonii]|uniref:Glycosyltransferase, group 2 family protein n=1 Tax=Leptospira johnsonii TaxID=1917820 RepID=A0A2P2CYY7_9LEPT|nr:glycosyltransferase family 2 protein [Leptospira johnsonii]GBF37622.1 glycosyltransferase, group 2 family protein [Leptospira johnsonii]